MFPLRDTVPARRPPVAVWALVFLNALVFLREAQLVQALQVEPKFGCRPEEMGKSQSRIARNSTSSVQDFSHTIGWNPELPRKLSSTHVELFEFFRQMLARVNCRNCHKILLVVVNGQRVKWPGYINHRETRIMRH